MEFKDYSTRYRPGLDLVLKGITCTIDPGEKVFYKYLKSCYVVDLYKEDRI